MYVSTVRVWESSVWNILTRKGVEYLRRPTNGSLGKIEAWNQGNNILGNQLVFKHCTLSFQLALSLVLTLRQDVFHWQGFEAGMLDADVLQRQNESFYTYNLWFGYQIPLQPYTLLLRAYIIHCSDSGVMDLMDEYWETLYSFPHAVFPLKPCTG